MRKISAGRAAMYSTAAKRPLSTLAVLAVWWVVKSICMVIWRLRTTLGWLVVVMVLANTVGVNLGFLGGFLGIGLIVAGFWFRNLWTWAPIMGDAVRLLGGLRQKKAAKRGNIWLRHVGLVSADDGEWYPVSLEQMKDRMRLTVHEAMKQVSYEKWVQTAQEYGDLFDAKRVLTKTLGQGACQIDWLQIDALDEPFLIDEPAELNVEKMSVECARNVDGSLFALEFADNAAMVVAGMPGSGKTAGISSFLLPMALNDNVELSIIDGKGGTDWTSYAPVARRYISLAESDDFDTALLMLRNLKDEMGQRFQTQQSLLGQSNFWNATASEREKAGLKFKLLVIDECQEIFMPSDGSKEAKARAQEMTTLITTIVKRGRSAGCFVILITQKTTTDAIPSSIRDNSGLKVAFRLETAESERAVLGSAPEDPAAARATAIPRSRPGGAVLVTDTGAREMVRFAYMTEKQQRELLRGD